MPTNCPACNFKYERAPGYFLGSSYINYGITALTTTALFIIARFGFNLTGQQVIAPLTIYVIVLPLLLFRHARALWLTLDCALDSSVLDPDEQ